jgi:NADPH:quinone reductase-like Zn-dependent oxidoreductase
VASASAAKHGFLAELGVDEAIDYTSQPVEDAVGDIDVVLDLVGSEETARALGTLRHGGLFVVVPSAAGLDTLREAAGDRVRVTGILVEPDRAGLEALAGLVDSGELRPHIAATFPLEHAARAHEAGETGRTQGKLVLTID